jgi:hypothetical protein
MKISMVPEHIVRVSYSEFGNPSHDSNSSI